MPLVPHLLRGVLEVLALEDGTLPLRDRIFALGGRPAPQEDVRPRDQHLLEGVAVADVLHVHVANPLEQALLPGERDGLRRERYPAREHVRQQAVQELDPLVPRCVRLAAEAGGAPRDRRPVALDGDRRGRRRSEVQARRLDLGERWIQAAAGTRRGEGVVEEGRVVLGRLQPGRDVRDPGLDVGPPEGQRRRADGRAPGRALRPGRRRRELVGRRADPEGDDHAVRRHARERQMFHLPPDDAPDRVPEALLGRGSVRVLERDSLERSRAAYHQGPRHQVVRHVPGHECGRVGAKRPLVGVGVADAVQQESRHVDGRRRRFERHVDGRAHRQERVVERRLAGGVPRVGPRRPGEAGVAGVPPRRRVAPPRLLHLGVDAVVEQLDRVDVRVARGAHQRRDFVLAERVRVHDAHLEAVREAARVHGPDRRVLLEHRLGRPLAPAVHARARGLRAGAVRGPEAHVVAARDAAAALPVVLEPLERRVRRELVPERVFAPRRRPDLDAVERHRVAHVLGHGDRLAGRAARGAVVVLVERVQRPLGAAQDADRQVVDLLAVRAVGAPTEDVLRLGDERPVPPHVRRRQHDDAVRVVVGRLGLRQQRARQPDGLAEADLGLARAQVELPQLRAEGLDVEVDARLRDVRAERAGGVDVPRRQAQQERAGAEVRVDRRAAAAEQRRAPLALRGHDAARALARRLALVPDVREVGAQRRADGPEADGPEPRRGVVVAPRPRVRRRRALVAGPQPEERVAPRRGLRPQPPQRERREVPAPRAPVEGAHDGQGPRHGPGGRVRRRVHGEARERRQDLDDGRQVARRRADGRPGRARRRVPVSESQVRVVDARAEDLVARVAVGGQARGQRVERAAPHEVQAQVQVQVRPLQRQGQQPDEARRRHDERAAAPVLVVALPHEGLLHRPRGAVRQRPDQRQQAVGDVLARVARRVVARPRPDLLQQRGERAGDRRDDGRVPHFYDVVEQLQGAVTHEDVRGAAVARLGLDAVAREAQQVVDARTQETDAHRGVPVRRVGEDPPAPGVLDPGPLELVDLFGARLERVHEDEGGRGRDVAERALRVRRRLRRRLARRARRRGLEPQQEQQRRRVGLEFREGLRRQRERRERVHDVGPAPRVAARVRHDQRAHAAVRHERLAARRRVLDDDAEAPRGRRRRRDVLRRREGRERGQDARRRVGRARGGEDEAQALVQVRAEPRREAARLDRQQPVGAAAGRVALEARDERPGERRRLRRPRVARVPLRREAARPELREGPQRAAARLPGLRVGRAVRAVAPLELVLARAQARVAPAPDARVRDVPFRLPVRVPHVVGRAPRRDDRARVVRAAAAPVGEHRVSLEKLLRGRRRRGRHRGDGRLHNPAARAPQQRVHGPEVCLPPVARVGPLREGPVQQRVDDARAPPRLRVALALRRPGRPGRGARLRRGRQAPGPERRRARRPVAEAREARPRRPERRGAVVVRAERVVRDHAGEPRLLARERARPARVVARARELLDAE